MKKSLGFHYYLSSFLAKYLPGEVGASKNTILSYRDTFTLFLKYCKNHEGILPESMSLDLFAKELIERFMFWIEGTRNCSVSTRNQRLAAIHSFCRFMQTEDVERINHYQRILGIHKKKAKSGTINYISLDGIRLILEQPNKKKPSEYRDLVLLSLMYDSGARVQEIADLSVSDVRTDFPATVKISGKGGKSRIVPLMEATSNLVKNYIEKAELSDTGKRSYPLFSNCNGCKLTRSGIKYILAKYVETARNVNVSLLPDVISPHSFRHSKAMHLLQAGVNLIYIRDILGHSDIKTTEIYARIDSEMKRKALEEAFVNVTPSDDMPIWQKDGDMLEWLKGLGK